MGDDMGSIDLIKESFFFWKGDLKNLVIPTLEAYALLMLAQMVLLILLLPVYLVMFIPIIISGDIDAEASDTLMGVFILVLPVILLAALVAMQFILSISSGGLVHALNDVMDQREVELGDVVKYGWSNNIRLFTIGILNLFMILILSIGGALLYSLIISLLITIHPLMGLVVMLVTIIPLIIIFGPVVMILQSLPFVVNEMEEHTSAGCVIRSYSLLFANFPILIGFGVLYYMLLILLSFIPPFNIFISFLYYPFLHTCILKFYRKRFHYSVNE
jgi:hypothetical protein